VAAGIVFAAVAAIASSGSNQGEKASNIEQLSSKEFRTRDAAVDAILHGRLTTVQKLIPLIDPANAAKYSDETRCAAAYLLGELRAVEAVPVLSKALVNEPGPKMSSDLNRYNVPALTALIKIGRPTVPTLIKNLETSNDQILRDKSLGVLIHVLGGKRRLLELLAKLEKRSNGEETRRRIEECITYVGDTFKESEKPLY